MFLKVIDLQCGFILLDKMLYFQFFLNHREQLLEEARQKSL